MNLTDNKSLADSPFAITTGVPVQADWGNQTIRRIATVTAILILTFASSAHALTPDIIETVLVGNTNNIGEVQSQGTFGAVNYAYRIGTTEVTNAQYTVFLNAVADTDPHALYNTSMASNSIVRTGSSGSFSYAGIGGREQHPVGFVSFWDAARYTNWLHNGQLTGAQGLGTTENGAYFLNGVTNPMNNIISRELDARWAITSEDEWYKAAYHQNDGNTGNYWDFPTQSDGAPAAQAPPGGTNSANYNNAVGDSTIVGAYTGSASAYGTFDQGGNFFEWNEAIIDSTFRGVRGGNWFNDASIMISSNRGIVDPITESNIVGFRVASLVVVPEPNSLLIGAIVLVGGFLKRRRR